jgi:hypothetical protein
VIKIKIKIKIKINFRCKSNKIILKYSSNHLAMSLMGYTTTIRTTSSSNTRIGTDDNSITDTTKAQTKINNTVTAHSIKINRCKKTNTQTISKMTTIKVPITSMKVMKTMEMNTRNTPNKTTKLKITISTSTNNNITSNNNSVTREPNKNSIMVFSRHKMIPMTRSFLIRLISSMTILTINMKVTKQRNEVSLSYSPSILACGNKRGIDLEDFLQIFG